MTKAQTTRFRQVESDCALHSYLAIDRIRTRQRKQDVDQREHPTKSHLQAVLDKRIDAIPLTKPLHLPTIGKIKYRPAMLRTRIRSVAASIRPMMRPTDWVALIATACTGPRVMVDLSHALECLANSG